MKRSNLFSILIFLLSGFTSLNAQQLVVHDLDFESGLQSMWGADGTNFSINQSIPLFPEVNWNESFSHNGIVSAPLGLGDFGAAISGNFSGTLGCEFSLQGFTLGQLEVDYPIQVSLDMPTDNTYDQGDDVTIHTEYQLAPGYALETYYPSGGEASLDLYFGIGAGLSAEVCLFGCLAFPVIPDFNTGIQNINIFNVDVNDVSLFSINGGTPLFSYPIFPLNTSMIPGDPLGQFGLNGTLDVPYVSTTDYANGLDLSACGEDPYVNLNLDIFAMLSNLPIPGAAALGYLSGSQDLGFGATLDWNFLSASLDVNIYNKQCFDFTPKVYGEFQFPVPVEYQIEDGVTGTLSARDESSIISLKLGDKLLYKFPCYFDQLDITPTYTIDGIIRNHTWDSIPVDFLFSAFEFGITIPEIELIPAIETPELCIGYPCGWFEWCTECWDPPDIPAVSIDPPDFHFGPLVDLSVPITAIEYDWFNDQWSLPGFDPITKPAFTMKANHLGITSSHTDVSCNGGNDGTISATLSAISPALPYTYEWTNGSTIEDLTNLEAGPYELSAFDSHGCQLFTGQTILEPEQPVSVIPTKIDKSCNGGIDDGQISLLIQGGTSPYTVAWSNGASGQSISGLAAGNYSATITDSKGCTEIVNVSVNEPFALAQAGIVTDALCYGDQTGEISIDPYGGTLPYTFNWSSGQTSEDLSGLNAGSYSLTLSDARGCANTVVYNVGQPNQPLTLSTSGVDVLCKDAATGSVNLSVSGGTAGYVFEWSNSAGIMIPFQTEDLSGVSADTYTVQVEDANGCIASTSETLTEPANPIVSNEVITHVLCNGNTTGAIDPLISGGTSSYSYSWSNGSNSSILSNVGAGNYSLSLTDNNGCNFSKSYIVKEPDPIILNSSKVDVLCYGESTGSVSISASGATPGYTYLWSNGSSSQSVSNLPAGNYIVNLTDAVGCVYTTNVIVNQPLAPLSATSLVTNVDCFGNASGSIDMTVGNGTSPYTYLWSNSGSVIFVDTTQDISGLTSGNYLLTITDDHNCTLDQIISVSQPNAPLQLSSLVSDVTCFSGTNGAINASISGGSSGYTYNWNNGSTNQDLTSISSGNYTLVVSDMNGCQIQGSYFVSQPSTPVSVTLEAHDATCKGASDGYLISNESGGIAPYSYVWSNGAVSDNIYNLPAGVYTLTVTDANGCTAFTGSPIMEPNTGISLTYTVSDVLCFGGNDGSIFIQPSGGTMPYYFDWGNQQNILMSEEGETLSNLNIGEYLIRVIDAQGCIREQIVQVNEPALLETDVIQTAENLCYQDSIASVDVSTWGGTSPYTYVWSNGVTDEDIDQLGAGLYSYIVTDAHNCVAEDSIYISHPPGIWSTYTLTDVSCMDQSDGYINVELGGGTGDFTYQWSNGSTNNWVGDLAGGNYTLVFADSNACTDSLFFTIQVNNISCLDIPNTFTPNGDDYNDTWFIENLDLYPNAYVAIFNKWGNELFSHQGIYSPWDGIENGKPLPSDVYYFVIILNNPQNEKFNGTVTIVR